MKLASVEVIKEKLVHSNADNLEIVKILGYSCIVRKQDYFKVGEKVVFIQPDTVLPNVKWAEPFKKSSRVRAIKLRSVWSQGIVLKLKDVNLPEDSEGEVSEMLGIVKYEPPIPQDLAAKGGLPFNIPKTDEERIENLDVIPWGEIVDITLKRDGRSCSLYAVNRDNEWYTGVLARTLELKIDKTNLYTQFSSFLPAILNLAKSVNKSIVIRGEITGFGVQAHKINPHATGKLLFSVFSVYLVDEHRYVGINEDLYPWNGLCDKLNLNTCEMLERHIVLTEDLVNKYANILTEINGQPFEGVVIKLNNGNSFKVINKYYDSNK